SKRAQPVQRQLAGDLWRAERKPRVDSRPAGGDAVVARAAAAAPRVAERAGGDRQPCRHHNTDKGGKPMRDLQAIADRVEIEALRGEFTDAVMMRDYDRVASLFTPTARWRRGFGSTSCNPPTRARSGWPATPPPAVPTCKNSGAFRDGHSE